MYSGGGKNTSLLDPTEQVSSRTPSNLILPSLRWSNSNPSVAELIFLLMLALGSSDCRDRLITNTQTAGLCWSSVQSLHFSYCRKPGNGRLFPPRVQACQMKQFCNNYKQALQICIRSIYGRCLSTVQEYLPYGYGCKHLSAHLLLSGLPALLLHKVLPLCSSCREHQTCSPFHQQP